VTERRGGRGDRGERGERSDRGPRGPRQDREAEATLEGVVVEPGAMDDSADTSENVVVEQVELVEQVSE